MSYAQPSLMPSFTRPASRVAIVRSEGYGHDLGALIFEALREFELPVTGKKVLLKPNFVEPDPEGTINTNPAVVGGVREAFLRLGAESVVVAEGPGHERDTEGIVETIRLRDFLGSLPGRFVDLNLDEVQAVNLRTRASKLKQLYFPRTVLEADYIVSMPKLKTHHWVGATLSLKNMFGIVPGCCYGWPKNVLHWAGITLARFSTSTAPCGRISPSWMASWGWRATVPSRARPSAAACSSWATIPWPSTPPAFA